MLATLSEDMLFLSMSRCFQLYRIDICYISQLTSIFLREHTWQNSNWGDRCPVSQPYFSLIPVGRAPKIQKKTVGSWLYCNSYCKQSKAGEWEGTDSGKAQTVGRQRQWEGTDSGKAETVGRQRQWEGRDSGKAETVGRQRQWEGTDSGKAQTVGRQRQWEGTDSGKAETVGRHRQWEGRDSGKAQTVGRHGNIRLG